MRVQCLSPSYPGTPSRRSDPSSEGPRARIPGELRSRLRASILSIRNPGTAETVCRRSGMSRAEPRALARDVFGERDALLVLSAVDTFTVTAQGASAWIEMLVPARAWRSFLGLQSPRGAVDHRRLHLVERVRSARLDQSHPIAVLAAGPAHATCAVIVAKHQPTIRMFSMLTVISRPMCVGPVST